MTVSVFDHPLTGGLFGDDEISDVFDAPAQLEHACLFEAALTRAAAAAGLISQEDATAALERIETYEPDMDTLRAGVELDGVLGPALVRALRDGFDQAAAIHPGATSQDIADTSLALTLKTLSGILARRLTNVIENLAALDARFSNHVLMGHTRMQPALDISASHRIAQWRIPLQRLAEQLGTVTQNAAQLQLGGPVGDRAAFGAAAPIVAAHMAEALELGNPGIAWHSNRQDIVAYGDWMSHVTGALGKMGQDLVLMAQTGPEAISHTNGGASSAMPHKANPVGAELMVALARFNAAQVAALHGTLVHEQERSGAAWMVEWMVLPPMAAATGRALVVADAFLGGVTSIGRERS